MSFGFHRNIVAGVAMAALVATPVLAEKAEQLRDINGMRGSSAEGVLQQRGFAHESTHKNSTGYVYSYWWNERDDDCVRVEVYDGRVESISDATDQDCGHHKGDAAAAVGVAAGAAILGALLGHKSHHREGRDYDETQTAEFERGYQDGLHHAQYHNYNRDDAYAHGYEKGAEEREANLSHHKRRGGYAQTAQFNDLKGARAAGGMSELERRGFRQVDNFTSGNTRYSIQWRPQSTQCVQVTISDGRFYDLRDIGRHPRCSGNGGGTSYSPPARYDDQIGRSGARARDTLGNRGFTRVARFGDDNTRYSIMWRAESNQCLQLMVVDGRVADIRDIGSHPNCAAG